MGTSRLLLTNLLILAMLVSVLWGASLRLRNASIVDVFWGFGFVVVVWLSYGLGEPVTARATVLTVLVTIWGMRLTLYLGWRNLGKSEDHRYAAMRSGREARFWIWSLVFVFLLQGLLIWIIALPLQLSMQSDVPLGWLDAVGVVLWGTGLLMETIADWQLARFKARPKNQGRVLNRGLWRYTRHPNYFGDFLVWWGFYFIAVGAGGLAWTIFSPLIMSVLLMRVSGVTLLEKTISDRRPDYEAYMRTTNAFFPWFPREEEGNA